MKKRYLSNKEVERAAVVLVGHYIESLRFDPQKITVYGVPRGGYPVSLLVANSCGRVEVVDKPSRAELIVDDIIDSGQTRDRFKESYPKAVFLALADFLPELKKQDEWLVFPWELSEGGEDESADDIPLRLLQFIGEDPKRGGLLETPKRFLKAWQDWASGYGKDPAKELKVFEDGAESCDQMVVVKDLPFYSHCEHHLAPFFGTATIAYIPHKRIVGLSKLSRVLDIYAKRLQVQERLTNQVADALESNLAPKGVGVLIKARHLCMESRGICKQGHETITSALRGDMLEDNKVRMEFLDIAKG